MDMKKISIVLVICSFLMFSLLLLINLGKEEIDSFFIVYNSHSNITSTIFWVGEEATEDNAFIHNFDSAWDENWMENYWGIDDPSNRKGYYPSGFVPSENPFYVALPYSSSGLKNSWIKITKGTLSCYAQLEDVGPFETEDYNYVFKGSPPKNTLNDNAGIDVSPAVKDCLNLEDIDKVTWQFVTFSEVPNGPWKNIITNY